MKTIGAAALAIAAALGFCSVEPPETKDRLSPERMERLVATPMAAVRERGLRAGDAAFQRLVAAEEARSGRNSVKIADLLTAYGVELYLQGILPDDRALLQASRARLAAAVAVHRAAFGPDHPEVALALTSMADVDVHLNKGRLTPRAEAALREALRIRRASLGPQHRETLATEERLAEIAPADPAGRSEPEAGGGAAEQSAHAARE
jgi:hypothetical protein